MNTKAIDFDENDDGFDYVIDIEFVREVSYRRRRVYGVHPNCFLVWKPFNKLRNVFTKSIVSLLRVKKRHLRVNYAVSPFHA